MNAVDATEAITSANPIAPPVDLLTRALNELRLDLADRSVPVTIRIRRFWAIAKVMQDLAASDVLDADLVEMARVSALLADLGRWGSEDLAHVMRWAREGLNPFGRGK